MSQGTLTFPIKNCWASQVALVVKNPPANESRHKRCGFDLWVSKIPGERNGNPLQYSCLENPMDRGAWRLRSIELHRVRHDLSNLARMCTL